MDLQVLNPLNIPDWDRLLAATPGHSFFHTSGWARVLSHAYGYKPSYFACMNEERFSALTPVMDIHSPLTGRRGVSLPFSDSCETISNGTFTLREVADRVVDHGRRVGWRSMEWRGEGGFEPNVIPSASYYAHSLALAGGPEEIFSRFRDSNKRNIKKAANVGVQVAVEDSSESVEEFYRLNCLTRKEHGLPPQPFHFFRGLHEHVISKGRGFVSLASYAGRSVAAAVFLHFRESAVYKYGASDRQYQRLRANNLVMWEGIKGCAAAGCSTLSLGRTDGDQGGLLQFKRGWGASEHAIRYYKFDFRRGAFVRERSRAFGLHNALFRGLPLSVCRFAGALLYRHVG